MKFMTRRQKLLGFCRYYRHIRTLITPAIPFSYHLQTLGLRRVQIMLLQERK